MPRAGVSVAEQTSGGSQFKIEEGNVEVTNAKVVIDRPSFVKEGEPSHVCMAFTVRYWDIKWSALQDREEMTENVKIGTVTDKHGQPKFHPGLADGPDDNDPELEIGGAKDAGDQDEAEGNCLLSASGLGPDKKASLSVFAASLETHGFPAAMNNGYAPNYIGLKFHASRYKAPKDKADDFDTNYLICGLNGQVAGGSITQMPGQAPVKQASKTPAKPAAKAAAAAAAAPAGKAAAPAAAPAAPPAASNGSGAYSPEEIAENTRFALTKVGETRGGQSMSLAKLATIVQTTALPQMAKDIPAGQHKSILANIKSAGWMGINAADGSLPGWVVEGDAVTFPAAE